MMVSSLEGESVLITGASSGIGEATARRFAEEGARLSLAARRVKRLEALADELREKHEVEVHVAPTDVRDPQAVRALVEATVDCFEGLDVLVCNAGVARGSSVEAMTDEAYRVMMGTNCDGMFHAAREALPYLRESEGLVMFVGSAAGKAPRSYNPVYAATKWWTRGFAKSLSAQAGDDVAVTIVNPAAVRTEFQTDGVMFKDRFEPGEVVEAVEVADAIVFAARQSPSMVHEVDVFNRDKLTLY